MGVCSLCLQPVKELKQIPSETLKGHKVWCSETHLRKIVPTALHQAKCSNGKECVNDFARLGMKTTVTRS